MEEVVHSFQRYGTGLTKYIKNINIESYHITKSHLTKIISKWILDPNIKVEI